MARPIRIQFEGAYYHVTVRGNAREDLFRDDHDRTRLLDRLKQAVAARMGVEASELRRRRRGSALRGVASRMLCRYAGLTQRAAAGELGVGTGSAVSVHLRRLEEAARRSGAWRRSATRERTPKYEFKG